MFTIKRCDGTTCFLSNELYEMTEDALFNNSKYKKDTLVRLISGVNDNPTPGYHWDSEYVTVCRVGAPNAEFVGLPKKNIRKLN